MTDEALDQVLNSLDATACCAFFQKMDEKERKAHAARALKWLEISTLHHPNEPQLPFWISFLGQNRITNALTNRSDVPKRIVKLLEQMDAARESAKTMPANAVKKEAIPIAEIAVLATSGLTEIKRRNVTPPAEHCIAVLSARKPKWLPEWANWITEEMPASHWWAVRQLEKIGALTLEANSNYLSAMVLALPGDEPLPKPRLENNKWVEVPLDEGKIIERLNADEPLLEQIWQILQDDQSMRVLVQEQAPMGNRDWGRENAFEEWRLRGATGNRWKVALIKLCRQNKLDRARLLAAIMPEMVRFNLESSDSASTLKLDWFTDIHTGVEPTAEERSALLPFYQRLLACRNSKAVSWAVQQISFLVSSPDFKYQEVCEAMSSVFLLKGKEHCLEALKCLKEIAAQHPAAKHDVAIALIEAMENESNDVQKRALSQLAKSGIRDDRLVEALQAKMSRISVMNREAAQKWIGTDGPADTVEESVEDSNVVPLRPANLQPVPTLDLDEYHRRCDAIPANFRALAKLGSGFQALEGERCDLAPMDYLGNEVPRLNPDKPLQLLPDLDALIFYLSQRLHHVGDRAPRTEDLEVMLDGFARFGSERPPDFAKRTEAILAEAQKHSWSVDPSVTTVNMWVKDDAGPAGWLSDFNVKNEFMINRLDEVLRDRFVGVGKKLVKREPIVVLSTPTHDGCWIDPLILVERTRQFLGNQTPGSQAKSLMSQVLNVFGAGNLIKDRDLIDQSLSLLRLAPDNRDLALKYLEGISRNEYVDALRYALGADDVSVGVTTQLWIAASRARNPFVEDTKVGSFHPGCGPDATTPARFSLKFTTVAPKADDWQANTKFRLLDLEPKLPANENRDLITVQLHKIDGNNRWNIHYRDFRRTVMPMCLDSFFADAIERVACHDGYQSLGRENNVYFEKLYDPDVPVNEIVAILLALGASSKQTDEHAAAIEAIIATIDDGRLNSTVFGEIMHRLWHCGALRPGGYNGMVSLISPTRWSKAFKPVAQVSPYHAHVIRLSLERVLQGDASKAHKDVHYLLEIMLEILLEHEDELELPETVKYLNDLSQLKSTGKTGKLIKQILKLKKGPNAKQKRLEALQYGFDRRLERAERWSDWYTRNRAAHESVLVK